MLRLAFFNLLKLDDANKDEITTAALLINTP